jgi:hypothetical protein
MLENIPLSAYAICYGPLALTIILFITYATLTDAHARRTYLRRLDPRTEAERGTDTPIVPTRTIRTQTPAGLRVTIAPQPGSPVPQVDPTPASEPPPETPMTDPNEPVPA